MKNRDYRRLNSKPKYVKKVKSNKTFNYASHWKKLSKEDPNNQELQVLGLLLWLGLDYKFVGNAVLIVPGYIEKGFKVERCPDFVRNDSKKIIELFGERWHEPEEEKERISFFKQTGYDTLIIWGKELNRKNRNRLVRKILDFNGS